MIIATALGVVCYGLFYNRSIWLSVVGYSVAPAERVMLGEVPYRDFIYNYTPGILWFNAFLMQLFGASLLVINKGLYVIKVATLVILYLLAKKLTCAWTALIPVVLALAWIGWKYVFGIYPTQYSMLFVLLGLWFMLRFNEKSSVLWLILSGMSVGAVFVFKYNVGILLLAGGTAAICARELLLTGRAYSLSVTPLGLLKRSLPFWIGFAIVVGGMLACLAAQGALGPMVSHFMHFAGEYGNKRSVKLPSIKLLAPALAAAAALLIFSFATLRIRPGLFRCVVVLFFGACLVVILVPDRAHRVKDSAMAAMAYLPPVTFALLAVAAAMSLKMCAKTESWRVDWWRENGILTITSLFALGTYLEVFPRADYYHLVRALPPFFLVLLLLYKRIFPLTVGALRNYTDGARGSTALTFSGALLLLLTIGFHHTWRPHFDGKGRFIDRVEVQSGKGAGMLVPAKQAQFIQELSSLLESNSSPADSVFSFSQRGTGFYFLTGRRNSTPFVWWRNVGVKSEAREAVLASIRAGGPKLIVLQDGLKDGRIREFVESNYLKAGFASDLAVFIRME